MSYILDLDLQPQDIRLWLFLIILFVQLLMPNFWASMPRWLKVLLQTMGSPPQEVTEMVLDFIWWLLSS